MLDSDSRYLPVLSEPSSGPSSPQVHRHEVDQKPAATDAAKPRRVVANFLRQPAQLSNAIILPTKSSSQPKSCSTTIHRHSQSPVARTLHLESNDSLEVSVGDNVDSHGTELRRPIDVKWKSSRRSRDTNGVIPITSLYTPEKYHHTMRQIYGNDSKQCRSQQLTNDRSDTNSCADNCSHSAKNVETLNHVADSINENDPDLRGTCIQIVSTPCLKKLCQLIFCSLSVKYEPISIKIGRSVPE